MIQADVTERLTLPPAPRKAAASTSAVTPLASGPVRRNGKLAGPWFAICWLSGLA